MPKDNDPISGKKFIQGAVSPKTGLKALAFIPWLLLFIALGWAIYRTYIHPAAAQTQQIVIQKGAVLPGGQLTVSPTQKQEVVKKKWYMPSPFVEMFSFVQTDDRHGYGCRFGARWEF